MSIYLKGRKIICSGINNMLFYPPKFRIGYLGDWVYDLKTDVLINKSAPDYEIDFSFNGEKEDCLELANKLAQKPWTNTDDIRNLFDVFFVVSHRFEFTEEEIDKVVKHKRLWRELGLYSVSDWIDLPDDHPLPPHKPEVTTDDD